MSDLTAQTGVSSDPVTVTSPAAVEEPWSDTESEQSEARDKNVCFIISFFLFLVSVTSFYARQQELL